MADQTAVATPDSVTTPKQNDVTHVPEEQMDSTATHAIDVTESALDDVIPVDVLQAKLQSVLDWVTAHLLTLDNGIQLGLIVAALVPAALFGPRLQKFIQQQLQSRFSERSLARLAAALAAVATALALYIVLAGERIALGAAGHPTDIIAAALSLLSAWIVLRLITLTIRSEFWSRVAFWIVWPLAVLDAFGVLSEVVAQMKLLAIPLGESDNGQPIDISLFDVLRTLIYFAALFWLASTLGRFLEQRIQTIDELTPSLKALLVKILNILLPVVALLLALQIVGFNLATLAIFSGAVGLGIGLGLQKIVANFIAGFTLIADRSIKPGDVIEIDGTYGWVTSMQSRYVALRTRDGTEILIPNDTFMSEGVVNWSRSDQVVRCHAPFGVTYATRNLRDVQQLAIEVAKSVERVLTEPSPTCNVVEFGDNSVNFDLRFWIADPAKGMGNVRSDVYVLLWDALQANGIEIPFPQRDLHIRSWSPDAVPASITGAAPNQPTRNKE